MRLAWSCVLAAILQVNFKLYQHCKLADLLHLPKLHSTLYILLDILSKKESQIAFPLSQCVCVRERDPQTSCMRDEESERENKFLLKRELSKWELKRERKWVKTHLQWCLVPRALDVMTWCPAVLLVSADLIINKQTSLKLTVEGNILQVIWQLTAACPATCMQSVKFCMSRA
jgi:hypothetical protein